MSFDLEVLNLQCRWSRQHGRVTCPCWWPLFCPSP